MTPDESVYTNACVSAARTLLSSSQPSLRSSSLLSVAASCKTHAHRRNVNIVNHKQRLLRDTACAVQLRQHHLRGTGCLVKQGHTGDIAVSRFHSIKVIPKFFSNSSLKKLSHALPHSHVRHGKAAL